MNQDDLTKVWRDEVWGQFAAAVEGREAAWRTAWVASVDGEGNPHLRMMVLREVREGARELVFFTDPRTPKWAQFEEGSLSLGFWSPERKQQLRCRGRATLHTNDEVSQRFLAEVPAHFAGDYAALRVPGEAIAAPEAGWETGADWHFAVVVVTIDRVDWLELRREGHRRAEFLWEGEWRQSWVQP